MTAKVIKFTGKHRTPRESMEAAEMIGVHVFRSGGRWALRRYEPGRIVEMHGLSREELENLHQTLGLALDLDI